MPNPFFHFKQFSIYQDRCAMKVGTDAVVLGALADHLNPGSILDIGVGTGVLALMMAQRFPNSQINGVEIDKEAFTQAVENIRESPWGNSISICNQSFQEYHKNTEELYDMIVTNPPYFKDHLTSKDAQRNLALHNGGLSFGDLTKGVKSILQPKGVLWVILPPFQMRELEKTAAFFNLHPKLKIELRDSPGKKVIREINCFSFGIQKLDSQELVMKEEDGSHSASFRNNLKQFLLHF